MTVAMTVILVLVITAFISTVIAAMGKCPVWVPVLLLCVIALIQTLPLGK